MRIETTHSRFLLTLLGVFVCLSLADLVLTWHLLSVPGSEIIESNPIAGWMLENFGWGGMAAFKFAMMLLIGAIALNVARRRQQVGESLMVFGCGAQAAVVLTSVFMLRSLGGDDILVVDAGTCPVEETEPLPEDAMTLLIQKAVQAELRLTEGQLEHLQSLNKQRRDLAREARRLNTTELQERAQNIHYDECAFRRTLNPSQEDRLQQLLWQHRGPLAFIEPRVMDALEFTEEQQSVVFDSVAALQAERNVRRPRRDVSQDSYVSGSDAAKIMNRAMSVLTDEQRGRWSNLCGSPFAFQPRTFIASTRAAE